MGSPALPAAALPAPSSSCRLARSPPGKLPVCLPSCLSPPLLPVWMNVSSLTPWLLDFHTVRFSDSSGYFLLLNMLLSFFWLCEEAKYIYLCIHLGWKSQIFKYSNYSTHLAEKEIITDIYLFFFMLLKHIQFIHIWTIQFRAINSY